MTMARTQCILRTERSRHGAGVLSKLRYQYIMCRHSYPTSAIPPITFSWDDILQCVSYIRLLTRGLGG